MSVCEKCNKIVNFAHWNGEDHFLCDDCVGKPEGKEYAKT